MKVPITQSREWQKLQDDLGEKSYRMEGEGFEYLAIFKKAKLANYLYLPYGPACDNRKGFENSLSSLKELASKTGVAFIRIEPWNEKIVEYFPEKTRKSLDLNPKETWLLDLDGSLDDLKKKLPSRLIRYYRNREKNGLEVKTSKNPKDIKYLITLQNELAKEKSINTFSEEYLKTELAQSFSTLYYVTKRDEGGESIIAAGLVFDDKDTRYNLQGAQSETGRKLHATGILTIQLILDAKEKGLSLFDFWGIAPEGAPANHPWAGFTNFKKTFAGYELRHAGTYDIVLDETKYKLYRAFRRINRFIRRNS